jgi:hypothetical protein
VEEKCNGDVKNLPKCQKNTEKYGIPNGRILDLAMDMRRAV